jgi:putative copper export protein
VNSDPAALLGALTRWTGFAGTLLVVGACVFRFGLLAGVRRAGTALPPGATERAAALGLAAALILAIAAPLRLYAQGLGFVEPGEALSREVLDVILRESAWGRGWIAQFLGAGLAVTGFVIARIAPRPGWIMAAAGASAVVLAAPLTGHALAADRAGRWGYPLDALHLFGAGAWLGTLAVMLAVGIPGRRRAAEAPELAEGDSDATVAALVRAFSPIALAGAGTAILAGLVLAFRYLDGSIAALWGTGYGRALLLKLGVLAAVMALGVWNWRVVTPALDQPGAPARIRRSSRLELALGTLLLAVTAVLVNLPMPGE